MPRLSVNLNKIALLRNSRRTGVPDVARFALLARDAGADGITVHPPARTNGTFAPMMSLQFPMSSPARAHERFLNLCKNVRPEQCTIVPDLPTVFTSEEGWRLDDRDRPIVREAVLTLRALGCRVIVFVDPDPGVVERVPDTGADGIEIYTGSYASAMRRGSCARELHACAAAAARAATDRGLVVNVGHDLNLQNLPPLIGALPSIAEASIGHELTADALERGFERAVIAYRNALRSAAD